MRTDPQRRILRTERGCGGKKRGPEAGGSPALRALYGIRMDQLLLTYFRQFIIIKYEYGKTVWKSIVGGRN